MSSPAPSIGGGAAQDETRPSFLHGQPWPQPLVLQHLLHASLNPCAASRSALDTWWLRRVIRGPWPGMLCFYCALVCSAWGMLALPWPPGLFPTEAVSEVRVPGPAQPVCAGQRLNGGDRFNEPVGFYFGPASMFAPPGLPFVPPLSFFFFLPFLQRQLQGGFSVLHVLRSLVRILTSFS